MSTFSHSRLRTFEQCPRQYRWRYIDRLPSRKRSAEAVVGLTVHKVLERLYAGIIRGDELTLVQAYSAYDDAWEAMWGDDVIIRGEMGPADYREQGRGFLRDYYRSHYPFNDDRTVAVEHHIAFKLDSGRVTMRGYIDRLAFIGEKRVVIHDYKTSRVLPDQSVIDADRQLSLYQLGIEKRWPWVDRVDLVWHFLAHGRTLRSRRSSEQLRAIEGEVLASVGRIEAAAKADDHPLTEGTHCRWCEYASVCH